MDNDKPNPSQPEVKEETIDSDESERKPPPKRKRKYVEKGSLTEAQLIEEKRRSKSSKHTSLKTEEEKRQERRAANRLSAFQSRQRRLNAIAELQVRRLKLLLVYATNHSLPRAHLCFTSLVLILDHRKL